MSGITEIVHVDFSPVWRGGQQQLWLLAEELRRQGRRQTIVAPPGEVAARFTNAGFRVMAPNAAARRRARDADMIHAHDGHAHSWMMRAAFRSNAKQMLSRRVAFPIRSPFSRWKYRQLGGVIAVSRFVAVQVAATGIASELITIVPDGIDLEAITPARAARAPIRAQLQLPQQAPCLVCLGALTAEKGVGDAIAALGRMPPQCHLVLPGVGPLLGALTRAAAALGCAARVHFASAASRPAAEWVAAGDMLLMPSHAEGLGSAALLAMALEKPVVATRAGGIPELIEHEVTGLLVPVHAPPLLAAAVTRLLHETALAGRLVQAARARVAERHTAARMAAATVAAYEQARGAGV